MTRSPFSLEETLALIECTTGPVTEQVCGRSYTFDLDDQGRAVTRVDLDSHIECFLSVEHYRLVADGPVPSTPALDPVTPLAPVNPDEPEACIACNEDLVADDMVLIDESGGYIHTSCCGPEREGYTNNGEPLRPNDPIPTGTRYGDLLALDSDEVKVPETPPLVAAPMEPLNNEPPAPVTAQKPAKKPAAKKPAAKKAAAKKIAAKKAKA